MGRRATVAEPTWHQTVSTLRLPWLYDHRVDGAVVVPGTAYVEAALAAGRVTFGDTAEVTDLDILRPWSCRTMTRPAKSCCNPHSPRRTASPASSPGPTPAPSGRHTPAAGYAACSPRRRPRWTSTRSASD
ncbi:hypothetical protein [Streptomyces mirabilis]|uniref:hypothetical protein n=1 Tax=Streptomyces mirabilis TaxID=68239 RepID=UPI0033A8B10B